MVSRRSHTSKVAYDTPLACALPSLPRRRLLLQPPPLRLLLRMGALASRLRVRTRRED